MKKASKDRRREEGSRINLATAMAQRSRPALPQRLLDGGSVRSEWESPARCVLSGVCREALPAAVGTPDVKKG